MLITTLRYCMQQKANTTIRLHHRQDRMSPGIARSYAAAIHALSDATSPRQAPDGIIGSSWYSDRGYDGDDDREGGRAVSSSKCNG
jgi:hypothetical protein